MNINEIKQTDYPYVEARNKDLQNLIKSFHELMLNDKNKAIEFINYEKLYFGTLYVLYPLIRKYNLFPLLNQRNLTAIKLMKAVELKKSPLITQIERENGYTTQSVLNWMLETGYIDDGISNQYDELIDSVALVILKNYRDLSLLPYMVEIMFNRNRRGTFFYDLAWGIFETRNPNSLIFIANYLNSDCDADLQLAKKLLSFIPDSDVVSWINENKPFLEYTGESFQQKNDPAPFAISLSKKYPGGLL